MKVFNVGFQFTLKVLAEDAKDALEEAKRRIRNEELENYTADIKEEKVMSTK